MPSVRGGRVAFLAMASRRRRNPVHCGRAMEKGVVVVMTRRTGSGRVNGAGQAMIPAADLNAQKARVLLMLALTRTTDAAEVRKMFATFTLGEQ